MTFMETPRAQVLVLAIYKSIRTLDAKMSANNAEVSEPFLT